MIELPRHIKMPCRDCITLPICRSYILKNDEYFPISKLVSIAVSKCSLLDEYLTNKTLSEYGSYLRRIEANKILKYMESLDEQ
jgi:hypothetical protein